jgi:hypothetical protein
MMDSIDWTDQTYRALDELARVAFPGTGITAETLKRLARKGLFTVYRPGKAYVSNLANIREMMKACQVPVKPMPPLVWQAPALRPPDPFGRTDTEIASDRLDALLNELSGSPSEKRKRDDERAVRMSEQKIETRERRRAKARQVYREKKAQGATLS